MLINTAFLFFYNKLSRKAWQRLFVSANLKTVHKACDMRLYVTDSVSGLYTYPNVVDRLLCPRVCLKIAFCRMYVTICGRFGLNEGRIAAM